MISKAPKRRRSYEVYPWGRLRPGESFFIPEDMVVDRPVSPSVVARGGTLLCCRFQSVRKAGAGYASRHGLRFVFRLTRRDVKYGKPGLRVWRVA